MSTPKAIFRTCSYELKCTHFDTWHFWLILDTPAPSLGETVFDYCTCKNHSADKENMNLLVTSWLLHLSIEISLTVKDDFRSIANRSFRYRRRNGLLKSTFWRNHVTSSRLNDDRNNTDGKVKNRRRKDDICGITWVLVSYQYRHILIDTHSVPSTIKWKHLMPAVFKDIFIRTIQIIHDILADFRPPFPGWRDSIILSHSN